MQETNKDSALEMRFKQLKKYVTIGLVGVLLLSLLGTVYMGSLKQAVSVSDQNQQTQAKVTLDSNVCKVYPDQELCILARQIAANPGEAVVPKDGLNGKDGSNGKNGADGSNGVDGRGVKSFAQKSGNLIVTYTDNQTQDLGRVVGKDGATGATGATGKTGATGATGKAGTNGTNGTNGRGIVSSVVDSGGNLMVTYTDGEVVNAGLVVGPKGDPGEPGLTPTSIDTDASGNVTITYNNGTQKYPAGKIIGPVLYPMSCVDGKLTVTLSNGSSESIAVDCSPDNAPNIPGLSG